MAQTLKQFKEEQQKAALAQFDQYLNRVPVAKKNGFGGGVDQYSNEKDSKYEIVPLNSLANTEANAKAISARFYQNSMNSMNRATNPYGDVTKGYLDSLTQYAGIDTTFSFDGRYFHYSNYPVPINKGIVAGISNAVAAKIMTSNSMIEIKKLKWHLNYVKFLAALNKANRYLGSILKQELLIPTIEPNGPVDTNQNALARAKIQASSKWIQRTFDTAEKNAGEQTRVLLLKELIDPETYPDLGIYMSEFTKSKIIKDANKDKSAQRKGFESYKLLSSFNGGVNKVKKFRTAENVEFMAANDPTMLDINIATATGGNMVDRSNDFSFAGDRNVTYEQIAKIIESGSKASEKGKYVAKSKSKPFDVDNFNASLNKITKKKVAIAKEAFRKVKKAEEEEG